jgi:predicted 2-oxoglutarate/Fe(II)-dependent dioxygenase YbiX
MKEIKPETGKYVEFNSNRKHMVTELISGERFVLLCWYKNESK